MSKFTPQIKNSSPAQIFMSNLEARPASSCEHSFQNRHQQSSSSSTSILFLWIYFI